VKNDLPFPFTIHNILGALNTGGTPNHKSLMLITIKQISWMK